MSDMKCHSCGGDVPTNGEGEYLPHLQVPLKVDEDGTVERVLIRFVNGTPRCRKCKLEGVLAAIAICAADMGQEGYDLLRGCKSELKHLRNGKKWEASV